MIGKGANEIRAVTLAEVEKILEQRQGTSGEFGFEQQKTLDYAKKNSHLKLSDALEMKKELEALELKTETAVKLADILPKNKSQLMLILSKDRADLPEKKLAQLEEIIAKFSKKAKKAEVSKPVEVPAHEAAAEAPVEEKKDAAHFLHEQKGAQTTESTREAPKEAAEEPSKEKKEAPEKPAKEKKEGKEAPEKKSKKKE